MIAIALDNGVRRAELDRFFRKERRVNAAEDDPCTTGARQAAHFQSAMGISRMDTDADYVTLLNLVKIDCFESFVGNDGGAVLAWCGGCEYVEPAGGDNSNTERHVTGIDQVNSHCGNSLHFLQ